MHLDEILVEMTDEYPLIIQLGHQAMLLLGFLLNIYISRLITKAIILFLNNLEILTKICIDIITRILCYN